MTYDDDEFGDDAKGERDRGMKRVLTPEFAMRVRQTIRLYFKAADDFTGEDIRVFCENFFPSMKWPLPHHHNAWGAAINAAVRAGTIVWTGSYRHMYTKRSHARRTPVYRYRTKINDSGSIQAAE